MTPIISDIGWWLRKQWLNLAVILAAGVWGVILAWPRDSGITIVFCNSGQGDETLITQGFYQILIDGNRPGRALGCLDKFMPFFDRTVEVVMLSHPQLDHFGGLRDVIDRYHLISFVYNGRAGEVKEWEDFSKALLEEKVKIVETKKGDQLKFSSIEFSVLWPDEAEKGLPLSTQGQSFPENADAKVLGVQSERELNETSLVVRARYGSFDLLLTGDLDGKDEAEVARAGGLDGIEVLKVSHHGSKTSSTPEFLSAVRPKLAVIEVGKNSYGHPTKEAIERLQAAGARVMRTDKGDVVVRTDGRKWEVRNEQK